MITKDQLKVGLFLDFICGDLWSVYEIKQVDPVITIMPLYSSANHPNMNSTFEYDITKNNFLNIINDDTLQYYKKLSVFT